MLITNGLQKFALVKMGKISGNLKNFRVKKETWVRPRVSQNPYFRNPGT
jgi:hypothetical protein